MGRQGQRNRRQGYGWEKGKGKGSGKGVYGLDLMGNTDRGAGDSWGSDAQWPGDQWNGQGDWENMPLRSCDARYGRALAMLGPAPVSTHIAFDSIADTSDSYDVPITVLVINCRKPEIKQERLRLPRKSSARRSAIPGFIDLKKFGQLSKCSTPMTYYCVVLNGTR